ncbi:MAG TPA: PKD domain-containing protein, partial [Chitinophagales bacterium]|nr:PKD domain-containing protein [Chitinophagales bacterium]
MKNILSLLLFLSVFLTAGAQCQINYSYQPLSAHTYQFSFIGYGSLDSVAYIQWNFGDGDTSGTNNPLHTYADTGSYHVCLHIANQQATCIIDTCF